jgi:hypothetical protein
MIGLGNSKQDIEMSIMLRKACAEKKCRFSLILFILTTILIFPGLDILESSNSKHTIYSRQP